MFKPPPSQTASNTVQSFLEAVKKGQANRLPQVAQPLVRPPLPINRTPAANNLDASSLALGGLGGVTGGLAASLLGGPVGAGIGAGAFLGSLAPSIYSYLTKPASPAPSVFPDEVLRKPSSASPFGIGLNRGYTYREGGVFGPQPKITGWDGNTPLLESPQQEGDFISQISNWASQKAWEGKLRNERQAFENPLLEASAGLVSRTVKNAIGDLGFATLTLPERIRGVVSRTAAMPSTLGKPYGFLLGQNPEWAPNEEEGKGLLMELLRTLEPEGQLIEQVWGMGRGLLGAGQPASKEAALDLKLSDLKLPAGQRANEIAKFRSTGQWPINLVDAPNMFDYVGAHLANSINNAESTFSKLPVGEQMATFFVLPFAAERMLPKIIPKIGKMERAYAPSLSILQDWSNIKKGIERTVEMQRQFKLQFTNLATPYATHVDNIQEAIMKGDWIHPRIATQNLRRFLVSQGVNTFDLTVTAKAMAAVEHGLEPILETFFKFGDTNNFGQILEGLVDIMDYGVGGFRESPTESQSKALKMFADMRMLDEPVSEQMSKLSGLQKGTIANPLTSTNGLIGRQIIKNILTNKDGESELKKLAKQETFLDLLETIKATDLMSLKGNKVEFAKAKNKVTEAQKKLVDWAVNATLEKQFNVADPKKFRKQNEWKKWQSFFTRMYHIGPVPGVGVRNILADVTKLYLQDRDILISGSQDYLNAFTGGGRLFSGTRGAPNKKSIRTRGVEVDVEEVPGIKGYLTQGGLRVQGATEQWLNDQITSNVIKKVIDQYLEKVKVDVSDLSGMDPKLVESLSASITQVISPEGLLKLKAKFLSNPDSYRFDTRVSDAVKGLAEDGVSPEVFARIVTKFDELGDNTDKMLEYVRQEILRINAKNKLITEPQFRVPDNTVRNYKGPDIAAEIQKRSTDDVVGNYGNAPEIDKALMYISNNPESEISKAIKEHLQSSYAWNDVFTREQIQRVKIHYDNPNFKAGPTSVVGLPGQSVNTVRVAQDMPAIFKDARFNTEAEAAYQKNREFYQQVTQQIKFLFNKVHNKPLQSIDLSQFKIAAMGTSEEMSFAKYLDQVLTDTSIFKARFGGEGYKEVPSNQMFLLQQELGLILQNFSAESGKLVSHMVSDLKFQLDKNIKTISDGIVPEISSETYYKISEKFYGIKNRALNELAWNFYSIIDEIEGNNSAPLIQLAPDPTDLGPTDQAILEAAQNSIRNLLDKTSKIKSQARFGNIKTADALKKAREKYATAVASVKFDIVSLNNVNTLGLRKFSNSPHLVRNDAIEMLMDFGIPQGRAQTIVDSVETIAEVQVSSKHPRIYSPDGMYHFKDIDNVIEAAKEEILAVNATMPIEEKQILEQIRNTALQNIPEDLKNATFLVVDNNGIKSVGKILEWVNINTVKLLMEPTHATDAPQEILLKRSSTQDYYKLNDKQRQALVKRSEKNNTGFAVAKDIAREAKDAADKLTKTATVLKPATVLRPAGVISDMGPGTGVTTSKYSQSQKNKLLDTVVDKDFDASKIKEEDVAVAAAPKDAPAEPVIFREAEILLPVARPSNQPDLYKNQKEMIDYILGMQDDLKEGNLRGLLTVDDVNYLAKFYRDNDLKYESVPIKKALYISEIANELRGYRTHKDVLEIFNTPKYTQKTKLIKNLNEIFETSRDTDKIYWRTETPVGGPWIYVKPVKRTPKLSAADVTDGRRKGWSGSRDNVDAYLYFTIDGSYSVNGSFVEFYFRDPAETFNLENSNLLENILKEAQVQVQVRTTGLTMKDRTAAGFIDETAFNLWRSKRQLKIIGAKKQVEAAIEAIKQNFQADVFSEFGPIKRSQEGMFETLEQTKNRLDNLYTSLLLRLRKQTQAKEYANILKEIRAVNLREAFADVQAISKEEMLGKMTSEELSVFSRLELEQQLRAIDEYSVQKLTNAVVNKPSVVTEATSKTKKSAQEQLLKEGIIDHFAWRRPSATKFFDEIDAMADNISLEAPISVNDYNRLKAQAEELKFPMLPLPKSYTIDNTKTMYSMESTQTPEQQQARQADMLQSKKELEADIETRDQALVAQRNADVLTPKPPAASATKAKSTAKTKAETPAPPPVEAETPVPPQETVTEETYTPFAPPSEIKSVRKTATTRTKTGKKITEEIVEEVYPEPQQEQAVRPEQIKGLGGARTTSEFNPFYNINFNDYGQDGVIRELLDEEILDQQVANFVLSQLSALADEMLSVALRASITGLTKENAKIEQARFKFFNSIAGDKTVRDPVFHQVLHKGVKAQDNTNLVRDVYKNLQDRYRTQIERSNLLINKFQTAAIELAKSSASSGNTGKLQQNLNKVQVEINQFFDDNKFWSVGGLDEFELGNDGFPSDTAILTLVELLTGKFPKELDLSKSEIIFRNLSPDKMTPVIWKDLDARALDQSSELIGEMVEEMDNIRYSAAQPDTDSVMEDLNNTATQNQKMTVPFTVKQLQNFYDAIKLSQTDKTARAVDPNLQPHAQGIENFFAKAMRELVMTRAVAERAAATTVDNYIYNYGEKYNFDHIAEMFFGYPHWYLRTFTDYPRQILTDPNYLSKLFSWNQDINSINDDDENLPLWMRASVPVNVAKFGLKDLLGTDTVYMPILAQLSPLESLLNGDFTNATREKTSLGRAYNNLYGWGPGPHALVPLALGTALFAMAKSSNNEEQMNQAAQYFGYLGSQTRLLPTITAQMERSGVAMPVSGGVAIDSPLMALSAMGAFGAPTGNMGLRALMGASAIAQFYVTHASTKDGLKFIGTVYDQRRVANVLTQWGETPGKTINGIEITPEILQDAAIVSQDPFVLGSRKEYEKAFTVWSSAVTESRAQKMLPQLFSYFGGPGVSARGSNEILQEQMYNRVDKLYEMRKDPNVKKEDYEKQWLAFSVQFPNFPVYSMFKKYGNEAFEVYAYSALSRVGRGASARAVYDTVGLDYNIVDKFFDSKGKFEFGTEQSQFKEGIIRLALLLQSPDMATKQEWGEAAGLYHELQREMEVMFPGTSAMQDVYFDLEKVDRNQFLLDHLDLKARMDTELSVMVKDPKYKDKMAPYYVSMKDAEDFLKISYMSKDPKRAAAYQIYLENSRDWAAQKEKQFLADFDLFEFHRGYKRVVANMDSSVAALLTGINMPKLPKLRTDSVELDSKKAMVNAIETLAARNLKNYNQINAAAATGAVAGGAGVAGGGMPQILGAGGGGTPRQGGAGGDLLANWEYLYSQKAAPVINYVRELEDQLTYKTLQPLLAGLNNNSDDFMNALNAPLLSGRWTTFQDPLKWEESLVNYVKVLGGENLRSSMMLEASRGVPFDPNQMVWSKVIGTVKSLSNAEIGQYMSRNPELRDLPQVKQQSAEYGGPTLNALMDVVGAKISIQEDGTINVSGETVKASSKKGSGSGRVGSSDIEKYISTWSKHYYGSNIEDLFDQYIMVNVSQGEQAGKQFWKKHPQLAQYQAFANKLRNRYKKSKGGAPTTEQELNRIVKGVGVMMETTRQKALGDRNQSVYSIMAKIIKEKGGRLPKSALGNSDRAPDGRVFANIIAVIKSKNPGLAISFEEFIAANPVRRKALLQANPDLSKYITQFSPEQLSDIEYSYDRGLKIGMESTSRGGGVRVYNQRSGRTGL